MFWQAGALALGTGLAAATGVQTVSYAMNKNHKATVSSLNGELSTVNSQLTDAEAKAIKKDKELKKLTADFNELKKQPIKNKQAIVETAQRIKNRAAIAAGRNSAGVVAEAIPFVGIAAILGITAWDLTDYCSTMKDMDELQILMGEEPVNEDSNEVCGMELPTVEEVKEEVGKKVPTITWPEIPNVSSWNPWKNNE